MKKGKKRLIGIVSGALLLILCYLWGIGTIITEMQAGDESDSRHYVAVIAKSTVSAFWKSVQAGANAASAEYNLTMTFEGPENEEDYEAQNEMVRTAVENGAQVIIFSAVDYNGNAQAINQAAAQGVKIIVIDSEVNSDRVSCLISTDNYEAGRMAGYAALQHEEEALHIGIVNFDINSANGQQREKGFREQVDESGRVKYIETINVKSTITDAMVGTKTLIEENPDINVIATFNEWTSLGVSYMMKEMDLADEIMVVAFDSNVACVGMLETGEVDALIVQNPYAMGYLGIENAYNLIFGYPVSAGEIDTTTTLITRENMFDEECQRVLFAFD